jgi:glycerophosphoryl diester phosphodiesterase
MRIGERSRVIAHRGFSGRAPENTLVAVRQAIAVGADMVEVDVTLTADHRVVCIHDDTLDRTTNGTGPVSGHTLAQLGRLDAGSWFSSSFRNQRIPTLDEVLDTVRGRILINIEIKEEAVTDQLAGGIAERVVRLVAEREMSETVVISSFAPVALEHVRAIDPTIPTASLFNQDLHFDMGPLEVVAEVGSQGLNLSRKRVTSEIVDRCHSNGIPLGVYTVNRRRQMRRQIQLGVHAMFTDRPDRLITILTKRIANSADGGDHEPIEEIPTPAAR